MWIHGPGVEVARTLFTITLGICVVHPNWRLRISLNVSCHQFSLESSSRNLRDIKRNYQTADAIDPSWEGETASLLDNIYIEESIWHSGDPLQCFFVIPCSVLIFSAQAEQPYLIKHGNEGLRPLGVSTNQGTWTNRNTSQESV